MNIIEKARMALRRMSARKANKSNSMELSSLLRFLGIDPETDRSALSEATYFACIRTLGESVGKLPLKLQRKNERNGVEQLKNNPLYNIVGLRPNPYTSAATFWNTVERLRNHYGNAYVWIRGIGKDTTLWILDPECIDIIVDNRKILSEQEDIYYRYTKAGSTYMFNSAEIMHFRTSNTIDGIVGIPVKTTLAATVNGGKGSQDMLNRLYKSGFTSKSVLNYTADINDKSLEKFLEGVDKYVKKGNSEKMSDNIIPMPLGFTLQPLNMKLADSQFLELRQYSAIQIASAFGIKPQQIGDYTKSSYASAEAQQISFYVDTMLYIITQYEQELNYKLLSRKEQVDSYFKFNFMAVLRTDLKTQVETLRDGVNSGLYKPNEARGYLDLEEAEGGDVLMVNGTMIPLKLVGRQYVNDDDKGSEENE